MNINERKSRMNKHNSRINHEKNIYMFKWFTLATFTCSKSAMETAVHGVCERRRSGVLIINFEQISCIVFVLPLLALNK